MTPFIHKVYGPPGTGKTTALIRVVEKELERGVKPSQIIYTSFTRTAAAEARKRALQKFPQYQETDFPYFSTIHSICLRLLGIGRGKVFSYRHQLNFGAEWGYTYSEDQAMQDIFEADLNMGSLGTDGDFCEFFVDWYRHKHHTDKIPFAQCYQEYTSEHEECTVSLREMALYIQRRDQFKQEMGLWDFTDMLVGVYDRQLCMPGIRVIIRDEEQDLSPLLSAVATMWSKNVERVYVAGDTYQSLYGFMAAEPQLMLDLKANETTVLKQSYRCSPAVHDLSRRIVERMSDRYPDDDYKPALNFGPGQVRRVGTTNVDVTKRTFYLHRTNYIVRKHLKELIDAGIPFATARGKLSPLQKPAKNALIAAHRLSQKLAVPLWQAADLIDSVPQKGWLTRGVKASIHAAALKDPNLSVNSAKLMEMGVGPQLLVSLGNIWEIIGGGDDEKSYLDRLVSHYGYDVLTTPPNLIVGTFHSVKGMEADTVIINPTLTNRIMRGFSEDPDPENRIIYVAITRARSEVVITQPDSAFYYAI